MVLANELKYNKYIWINKRHLSDKNIYKSLKFTDSLPSMEKFSHFSSILDFLFCMFVAYLM